MTKLLITMAALMRMGSVPLLAPVAPRNIFVKAIASEILSRPSISRQPVASPWEP